MRATSRKVLTATAGASLIVLTACSSGGSNAEAPPALSEIEHRMWEAMQDEGSVTVTTDLSMLTAGDEDVPEVFGEILSGETSAVTIYGELDGSATAVAVGGDDMMRAFDQQEAYLAGDLLFSMFAGAGMAAGGSEQATFDSLADEFSGTWIDFSSEFNDEDISIHELFADLQDDWIDGDGDSPLDRSQISDTGTHDVRNNVDVWVYEGAADGQELVLEANRDAPKILEMADAERRMTFSEWGSTTSPERPSEADLIGQDELEQRMMQLIFEDALN